MNIQALPYVITLGFLFGSTLIASRFGVGQFNPASYVGLRFVIASLAHIITYRFIMHKRFPRDRQLWIYASILGVVGTAIPMTANVASLQFQSSGVTATLLTLVPALTVILAHFFLEDEKLTTRKAIGVTLAFSGAALLAVNGETGLPDMKQANPVGYALVGIGVVLASARAIYARKFMRNMDTLDVASVRMYSAAIAMLPVMVFITGIEPGRITIEGYGSLLWAALVGTFAGMTLGFYNIKRFGATSAAMVTYVIPIVAAIFGVLLLGETVTPVMMTSMGIIIAGIALIQQRSTPAIQ